MEKKPNLFVNKIDKKIDNNDRVFYSSSSNKKNSFEKVNNKKNNNLNQTN